MEKRAASAAIPRRVCVVGATGRVGSWLVKKLLERDHITVHATVRNIRACDKYLSALSSLSLPLTICFNLAADLPIAQSSFPVSKMVEARWAAGWASCSETSLISSIAVAAEGDPEKAALLRSLPGAGSRLHLFEADLFHPEQIEQAVHGCEFVFLVAFPNKPLSNDAEREDVTEVAMRYLKSVLTTCGLSGTVKRVIYTGSVVAASPLDEDGLQCRDFVDESCWTRPEAPIPYPSQYVKFYTTVKTASEELLMHYGSSKEGREVEGSSTSAVPEVVILSCGVIGGDALVDSLFGIGGILSPLVEKASRLDNFVFLQRLLLSVPLVHLDDACEAHLFCMDVPLPSGGAGRFLCASHYPSLRDIMAYYRRNYSELIIFEPEDHYVIGNDSIRGGSSKLKDMGFQYKYGVEETLDDSIRFAMKRGFIKTRS